MPTPPLSDRQKAERAAIKAVLPFLLGEDLTPAQEARATFLLTIVAHWGQDGEDECECAICGM